MRLPLQLSAHRTIPRQIRVFHNSPVRRDLVGPPDPISHLRPVVYDDAPSTPPSDVRHPYSLREFTGDTREYQWKIQRQQLDAYNHEFWTDSNRRFEAAKQAVLDSLPETSTPEYREVALSEFYGRWLAQELPRQREYTAEWRKRNWDNIILGTRVKSQLLWSRMTSICSRGQ